METEFFRYGPSQGVLPNPVQGSGSKEGEIAMFSHIMIGSNDIARSKKFYDAALGALGIPPAITDPNGRLFYMTPTGVFAVTKPIDGKGASHANGGTIGFAAKNPEEAAAW